jgi:RimJ/RimL family protein N-acetyltransferase
MAWDDLTGRDVTYASSPVESARFGISVGRITVGYELAETPEGYKLASRELAALLAQSTDAVLIARYPAKAIGLGAIITGARRDVVPAGQLTYWGADINPILDAAPAVVSNELDVVTAEDLTTQQHASSDEVFQIVDTIVSDSFAGYANHYLANPLLDRDAALRGYQDWARRSFESSEGGLILRHRGTPIGIATFTTSVDGRSHLEVLLAGLVRAAQGHGHYAALIAGCAAAARRQDRKRLIISTQTHNIRVQRAWSKLGLRPFATIETVHVIRRGLLKLVEWS